MKKTKKLGMLIALVLIVFSSCFLTACDLSFSVDATHKVTVSQNEHGRVSVNKTEAEEGETVTITATPDAGYSVYAILYNGVVLNSTTFTMPAKDVVVSAIFKSADAVENITIKKGSYIQICECDIDGTYVRQNAFYNTLTIKENNLCDIFINWEEQIVEMENIPYTQNKNQVKAVVNDIEFVVDIINDEMLMWSGSYDNKVFFHYYQDVNISTGKYLCTIYGEDDEGYTDFDILKERIFLELKENSKAVVTITNYETNESGTITFFAEGDYYFKGNTMFIETSDSYMLVKLYSIEDGHFTVCRITFVTKGEDQTFTQYEVDNDADLWITFSYYNDIDIDVNIVNRNSVIACNATLDEDADLWVDCTVNLSHNDPSLLRMKMEIREDSLLPIDDKISVKIFYSNGRKQQAQFVKFGDYWYLMDEGEKTENDQMLLIDMSQGNAVITFKLNVTTTNAATLNAQFTSIQDENYDQSSNLIETTPKNMKALFDAVEA